ncbi:MULTISPECIES: YitT family protein [unclassified Gemella]|uniref:YitT family protein n=1 Tax=unclassified Gemella TaxID=2624949 RepID=UPI001073C03E|nr:MULTISPECIES: YitT family protein [unclassified Gemella]MBF0709954.1 YitT family protein [Gemella sp. GL1.1]MBF0747325.1 YitT family protein [Gemella sp. 19428wG2_WT2a]NYS27298.1 YitT family protein [Gemella sp. GL1]TFU57519.1 YitT family protein [Gemella sp. WT2a]
MLKEAFFEVKKNRLIKQMLFLAIGIFTYSIYAGLLIPANNLSVGGALGLSLVINKFTAIKVGTIQFLLNLPLFFIAYRYIGKKFTILTFIVIMISAYFINNMTSFIRPVDLGDKLVASIFAGILSALAISCILLGGASTGGTEITGKFFVKKFGLNFPTVFLIQDIIIYIIIWIVFDIKAVMYAFVLSFVRNQTMKGIERFFSAYLQCTIIADETEKLVDAINKTLHRGSTIIDVEGGYTHKKQRMIIVVIQQNELYLLKKIVNKTCPQAFITFNSINTIMGNFKEHSYRL